MPAYKLESESTPEMVRTRPIQKMCYACMEYNYDWFVDDLQNPTALLRISPSAGSASALWVAGPWCGGGRVIG